MAASTSEPIFTPVDRALFFTKNDAQDLRLGDFAQALGSDTHSAFEAEFSRAPCAAVLAGYPDDEGISINGGRIGAALAPDRVRKYLYKMTPSVFSSAKDVRISDLGNLAITTIALAERHERGRKFARTVMSSDSIWLSLGGGHDYGYADAAAFVDTCVARGVKPLVLNFDAHLDVRPSDKGLSSGTPFYRLLEMGHEIDFAEIGLQGQCNSAAHYEWAQRKNARMISIEEMNSSGEPFVTCVLKMLGTWIERRRPVFLSVDIDGFTSSAAPGCSQSWATGFTPADFFALWQVLVRRLDVRGVGVYEVSPPLDHDDRTSKLAAQILHRTLYPL
jgi:formiminoglutamase